VAGNQVDTAFLAEVALACGASAALAGSIRGANTARHVQELVQAAHLAGFFQRLTELVAEQCNTYVKTKLAVEAVLFDFDGAVLGRAGGDGAND
jgi:cobalt-precorrin-5B (C1)-methyltransferase